MARLGLQEEQTDHSQRISEWFRRRSEGADLQESVHQPLDIMTETEEIEIGGRQPRTWIEREHSGQSVLVSGQQEM
jgi:hypothetical protein